jgi:ABC-type sugar transport system substrate-binding protein
MRAGGETKNVSHIFGQILQIIDDPKHVYSEEEKKIYQIVEIDLTEEQADYIRGGKLDDGQLIQKKYKAETAAWTAKELAELQTFRSVDTIDGVKPPTPTTKPELTIPAIDITEKTAAVVGPG